jgi:SanA protein
LNRTVLPTPVSVPVMKSFCFIRQYQSGNSIGLPSKPCSLHSLIFKIETHDEASHYSVRLNPIMFFSHQNKLKVKKLIKFMVIAVVIAVFLIVSGINLYVVGDTKTRIFNKVSDLPQREFGLVMGTDLLRFDGSTNLHFLNRTEGAAKIFLSGKVSRLLISGNKNNKGFNEVSGIESGLSAKGVPQNAMILDFNGNSTWESVRHAKEIYHLHKVTIVTDAFHAPRAVFLCRHFGIDGVAFCYGEEPFGFGSLRYHLREWFARVKAAFQVMIDRKAAQND